VRLGIKTKQK